MKQTPLSPQEKKWLLQGILDEIIGHTKSCRVFNDTNVEGGYYVVAQLGGGFTPTELETIDYMVRPLDLERTTTFDTRNNSSINLAPISSDRSDVGRLFNLND